MDSIEIPTIDEVFGNLENSGITVIDSPQSDKSQEQIQNEAQQRITGVGLSIFGPRGGKPTVPPLVTPPPTTPTPAKNIQPTPKHSEPAAPSAIAESSPKAESPAIGVTPSTPPKKRKESHVPALAIPVKVDSKTGRFSKKRNF